MKVLISCLVMVCLLGCASTVRPREQQLPTTTELPTATKPQAVDSVVAVQAEKADLKVTFVQLNELHGYSNGDSNARITFLFTNVSGKNIKAIQGTIKASDRFGASLGELNGVDIQTNIKTSSSIQTIETWNDVNSKLILLLEKFPNGPVFTWETTRVLYE
ncbi:MAG: hypothetical protein FWD61_14040 [Phycisphaerales bacterium]|nr:hypothetical protein [Phycisphaerales bacterium]